MLAFKDACETRKDASGVVAAAEQVLSRAASLQVRASASDSGAEDVASVRGFSLLRSNHAILRDVSFDVRRGEVAALTGPCGCGAKTMLAALGDVLPAAGQLLIKGEITYCTAAPVRDLAATVQLAGRSEMQSVRSVLARPLRLRGVRDGDTIDQAIDRAFSLMDVGHRFEGAMPAFANSLSKVDRNLIAIAYAYLKSPDILLVEDPTRGLGLPEERVIERALQNLACKANLAVVVETPDANAVRRIASRAHFFLQGGLVESLSVDRGSTAPADYRTRAFFEGRMR